MSSFIYVINGPNLNLLGQREPEIYGKATLKDIEIICLKIAKKNNIKLKFLQSNAEHEIINWIHNAREDASGIIINPAAYSHTSIGIADAVSAIETSVIEVHISNIYAREEFRHKSLISKHVKGVICGFGLKSYDLALKSLI